MKPEIDIKTLNQMKRQDADYQHLLNQCLEAGQWYLEVLGTLSPEAKKQLESYITLCEALDDREALLAYRLGRLNPPL